MPRNFNLGARLGLLPGRLKEPRVLVRGLIGVLLAANLVAAVVAFRPFGGSAEDLRREQEQLRSQVAAMQARLAQTKTLAAKVERARRDGQDFESRYMTDRRTTFSTIVATLEQAAKEAGIKPRPASIVLEPVEGSDDLHQMTISAAYEGTYANLTKFVNLLDRSPRFLIIESMTAAPQQSGQILSVSFKLDTFVRELPGSAL